MPIESIQLKWAHSFCQGSPGYLTNEVIFIPSDYTIETLDSDGKPLRSSAEPGIRIGCAAAMPELGVLAVCESSGNSDIFILNYPAMNKIQTLKRENTVKNLALQFTGLDFLVSVSYKTSYDIELWRWSSAERLYHIAEHVQPSEIPEISMTANPVYWNEICIQSNTRIRVLDIKSVENNQYIKMRDRLLFYDKDEDTFTVASESAGGDKTNHVLITCHCWLSKDCILMETSCGLVKLDIFMCQASSIFRESQNKQVITSMVQNNEGLFVGYKSGYVDVVNISRGRWFILETIKIGQSVSHLVLSPYYESILIATAKGSVFLHQGGSHDLKVLLRSDAAGQVGICGVGPLSQYCMVARKNGLLNLVKIATGSLASCIQLEEEITSVAGSPLCDLVLAGSNCGFLHFIDVTEPKHPKVVHCEKPHDGAIEVIKFSNYGRLIATAAEQNHVSIWNGMPTSRFQFLGSLQFPQPVKDLVLFRRKEDEDLSLFVLSVTGPSSEIGAGNVLIGMKIPIDFLGDPEKYQMDVFKTLNSVALNLKEWRLDHPCSKLEVHEKLGLVFYSPILKKIQRFPVWSESESKQVDVLENIEVDFLRVSHNQEWLGIIDIHGSFQLYNIALKKVSAVVNAPNASSGCHNFLDFNNFGDSLITGCETGYTMCYNWKYRKSGIKTVPKWVVFCQSNTEKENNYLKEMAEEETVDYKLRGSSSKRHSPLSYEEMQHKFQKYAEILGFRLDSLPEIGDNSETVEHHDFILDERLLQVLSEKNFQNLMSLGSQAPRNSSLQEKGAKNCSLNEPSVISATKLQYLVPNYIAIQELPSSVAKDRAHESNDDIASDLQKSLQNLQSKSGEEIFVLIQQIRKLIRNLKKEFNEVFERIYESKDEVTERLEDIVSEMKSKSAKLPSKSERDFYGAFFLPSSREFEENSKHHSKETPSPEYEALESLDTEQESSRSIKKSIEGLTKQANDMRNSFDSDVERLYYLKSFSDYVIHFHEVQILCILLFKSSQMKYSQCEKEIQEEVESLQSFDETFNSLLAEAENLKKSNRQMFTRIRTHERKIDDKIEAKCQKLGLGDDPYFVYRKKPDLTFLLHAKIPFSEQLYTLSSKDLTLDYLDMQCDAPKNVSGEKWKEICKQRNNHIKLSIILRHLQFQAMQITSIILEITETQIKMAAKTDHCRGILVDMEILFQKLSDDLQNLLLSNLEMDQLKFANNQSTDQHIHSLCNLPGSKDDFWNEVRDKSSMNRNLEQELEDIQSLLNSWLKLRGDIASQQDKYNQKISRFASEKKDEVKAREEAFEKGKPVIDEVADDKKKSFLKLFESK